MLSEKKVLYLVKKVGQGLYKFMEIKPSTLIKEEGVKYHLDNAQKWKIVRKANKIETHLLYVEYGYEVFENAEGRVVGIERERGNESDCGMKLTLISSNDDRNVAWSNNSSLKSFKIASKKTKELFRKKNLFYQKVVHIRNRYSSDELNGRAIAEAMEQLNRAIAINSEIYQKCIQHINGELDLFEEEKRRLAQYTEELKKYKNVESVVVHDSFIHVKTKALAITDVRGNPEHVDRVEEARKALPIAIGKWEMQFSVMPNSNNRLWKIAKAGFYGHPHMSSDDELCLGDMQSVMNEAIRTGDVLTMFELIISILTEVNVSSTYRSVNSMVEELRP
jgi:hypothetical protein